MGQWLRARALTGKIAASARGAAALRPTPRARTRAGAAQRGARGVRPGRGSAAGRRTARVPLRFVRLPRQGAPMRLPAAAHKAAALVGCSDASA